MPLKLILELALELKRRGDVETKNKTRIQLKWVKTFSRPYIKHFTRYHIKNVIVNKQDRAYGTFRDRVIYNTEKYITCDQYHQGNQIPVI